NATGTLSWTPSYSQAGVYPVTFTASNALSGSASTTITITTGDRPPVVTAPAIATAVESTLRTINITASDPDGPAITELGPTGLAAEATFAPGSGNTTGTLSWTPSYSQAGVYAVTFTASNSLSGTATTTITIANVDRPPAVTAPAIAS